MNCTFILSLQDLSDCFLLRFLNSHQLNIIFSDLFSLIIITSQNHLNHTMKYNEENERKNKKVKRSNVFYVYVSIIYFPFADLIFASSFKH